MFVFDNHVHFLNQGKNCLLIFQTYFLIMFQFVFIEMIQIKITIFKTFPWLHINQKRIGGVMVSVLASNAVDRGFEFRLC